MKNCSKWVGPFTLMAGLVMLAFSLSRPSIAQPPAHSASAWYGFDTTPTFPPGIAGGIQGIVGNLNRNGGADSAVYVPELHCLFVRYSR